MFPGHNGADQLLNSGDPHRLCNVTTGEKGSCGLVVIQTSGKLLDAKKTWSPRSRRLTVKDGGVSFNLWEYHN